MNQKQVWDNIAKEWNEFKEKPAKVILDFLKEQTGNVLDLGSGSGRHLVKIKNGKMFLVDFSEEMIKQAKENIKKKNVNAECEVSELNKIPYNDNFFDAAILVSSLHCVETKEKRKETIRELYRVLKPKSKAFISVWNKDAKRFKNAPKEKYIDWRGMGKRYYYLYDEKEIHTLFEEIGFKIIKKDSYDRNIGFIVEKTVNYSNVSL